MGSKTSTTPTNYCGMLRFLELCREPGTIASVGLDGFMAVKDKHLSVRLTEYENQLLEHYCRAANQSKTDVIRAYIRSLDKKANV